MIAPIREMIIRDAFSSLVTKAWANFFDRIAKRISDVERSGLTAERPVEDMYIGKMFFDNTLHKPIWWNGSAWIDATGATV